MQHITHGLWPCLGFSTVPPLVDNEHSSSTTQGFIQDFLVGGGGEEVCGRA